ncbi:MAG: hypothetical protein ACRC6E_10490 [Fusobacteriaceae bacterium]
MNERMGNIYDVVSLTHDTKAELLANKDLLMPYEPVIAVDEDRAYFKNEQGGLMPIGGSNTVDNIEVLKASSYIVGDVVQVLGYYEKGDGAHHLRKISDADDGSGELLANGLFANVVHDGEVNVSWFGEKIPNFNNYKKINIDKNITTGETIGLFSTLTVNFLNGCVINYTGSDVCILIGSEKNVWNGHRVKLLSPSIINKADGTNGIELRAMMLEVENPFIRDFKKNGIQAFYAQYLIINGGQFYFNKEYAIDIKTLDYNSQASNDVIIKNIRRIEGNLLGGIKAEIFTSSIRDCVFSEQKNALTLSGFGNVISSNSFETTNVETSITINNNYKKFNNIFSENTIYGVKNVSFFANGGTLSYENNTINAPFSKSLNDCIFDSKIKNYKQKMFGYSTGGIEYRKFKLKNSLEIKDAVVLIYNSNKTYVQTSKISNLVGLTKNKVKLELIDSLNTGISTPAINSDLVVLISSPINDEFFVEITSYEDIIFEDVSLYEELFIAQFDCLKLDTPYYTYKMQQEGIYEDYIAYRDELHVYEQSQSREASTLLLEPVVPQSIKEFATKYNLI